MSKKAVIDAVKRVSYKHVMAVIFLFMIFFVGAAALPKAVYKATLPFVSARAVTESSVLSAMEELDTSYREILEFKGNIVTNKSTYINLNGLLARAMGQRYMNETVKLDNGHLAYLTGRQNVTKAAEQIKRIFDEQNNNGKEFLFVLAPYQIPHNEDILPEGYRDFSNENADNLLKMLEERGIPALDLRDEMVKDNYSYSEAFYVTDHHWKPEAGFWAYGKILDYLTANGTIDPVDSAITDIKNYNTDLYEDWFLGSAGKRTSAHFAGADDFTVIYPKFKTNITLEIPGRNVFKQGDFKDVVFSSNVIRKDYFNANAYGLYGYGNDNGKHYQNAEAASDMKVLTIRDSFACVVSTFFPLVFSECRELDMRYSNGELEDAADLKRFFTEFDPDIVIVLINATDLNSPVITHEYFSSLGG